MWQTYHTPHTLNEALHLLAQNKTQARLVAGGTDLIVEIERGVRSPQVVIDITHLAGLDQITLDDQNRIRLGPLVTHNQVVASKLCRERAFPLAKACWEVGAPQIRNRGTVAGNLVTASPANDTISPLRALEAAVTLQSVRGTRTLALADFFRGVRKTALEPDEMVVDISFPAMTEQQIGTFLKLGLRRAQAISVVNVAVVLTLSVDTVTEARIALGSVAPTIVRAKEAEQFLTGQTLTPEVMAQAGQLAAQAASPISDVRGSAKYRRYMVNTLTRNALETLAAKTEREAVPSQPVLLWGHSNGHLSQNAQSATHTEHGAEPIVTTINGQTHTIHDANDKSLLRMLRENALLIGTKEGCAEGECGACTVLMDGIAVMSCLTPAPQAHGRQIITIEGLPSLQGDEHGLHPMQQAFVEAGAVQCGYCTPGFIMSGAALMAERPQPDSDEIKQALTGNLCRCTGYYKIIEALKKATSHV